jgi:hypothetical protein
MRASHHDQLASFSDHLASFVEQLKRVKPCAEARRQDQKLQLPAWIHQPRPD